MILNERIHIIFHITILDNGRIPIGAESPRVHVLSLVMTLRIVLHEASEEGIRNHRLV